MRLASRTKSVQELYPLGTPLNDSETLLVGPAQRHIADAWNALDALESGLPGGPDRWQADSLFVAREGLRKAWLALSNVDHGLRK